MRNESKSALIRLIELLEAAQFTDGSLDLAIHGVEGEPVFITIGLRQSAIQALGDIAAEISGVTASLQSIADAIRETKP